MNKAYIVLIAAAVVVGVVGWMQWFDDEPAHSDDAAGTLKIPTFSAEAEAGQALFEENCMTCHGRHATGSDQGPPLVHRIYEPNHHADISFRLAVRNGVRAHHWPFGNMAPVEGVSDVAWRRRDQDHALRARASASQRHPVSRYPGRFRPETTLAGRESHRGRGGSQPAKPPPHPPATALPLASAAPGPLGLRHE